MDTSAGKTGFGFCEKHKESVDHRAYTWKGCWGCQHFIFGNDFPYLSTHEVAEQLSVSESTVRRLIHKGELEGFLFTQGRHTGSLPAPPTYHITKESLERLRKDTGKTK